MDFKNIYYSAIFAFVNENVKKLKLCCLCFRNKSKISKHNYYETGK